MQRKRIAFSILDFSESFLKSTESQQLNIKELIIDGVASSNFKCRKKFDFILFQEVIEHTTSPFVSLANINNLLPKEGLLYLTLPNSNWYKSLLAVLKIALKNQSIQIKNTHISELSPIGVIKLLTMTGFSIETIYFYDVPFRNKFLGHILSSQVDFLAKKVSNPEDSWEKLEIEIVEHWKSII